MEDEIRAEALGEEQGPQRMVLTLCLSVVVASVVALVWLVMTNERINNRMISGTLNVERSLGINLSPLRRLLGYDVSPSQFFDRIKAKDKKGVTLLLGGGVDANAVDDEGVSPLTHAIQAESNDIVTLLLGYGALPNVPDEEGLTPLLRAAHKNVPLIVGTLIRFGANPNIRDKSMMTPLMHAASQNQVQVMQALLQRRVLIDARDDAGRTALLHAAKSGFSPPLRLLVDHGADLNTQDENGFTALIYAVENHDQEMIRILLARGARADLKNNEGKTALDYASSKERKLLAKAVVVIGDRKKQDDALISLMENMGKELAGGSGGSGASAESSAKVQKGYSGSSLPKRTRLRVQGRPEGTWRYSSRGIRLDYIKAEVRNVGTVPAKSVSVTAIIPGGERISLRGPSTLEPNEEALYDAKPGKRVSEEGKIRAKASCSNCWR